MLARSGLSVTVLESADVVGGACRTEHPFAAAPGGEGRRHHAVVVADGYRPLLTLQRPAALGGGSERMHTAGDIDIDRGEYRIAPDRHFIDGALGIGREQHAESFARRRQTVGPELVGDE